MPCTGMGKMKTVGWFRPEFICIACASARSSKHASSWLCDEALRELLLLEFFGDRADVLRDFPFVEIQV